MNSKTNLEPNSTTNTDQIIDKSKPSVSSEIKKVELLQNDGTVSYKNKDLVDNVSTICEDTSIEIETEKVKNMEKAGMEMESVEITLKDTLFNKTKMENLKSISNKDSIMINDQSNINKFEFKDRDKLVPVIETNLIVSDNFEVNNILDIQESDTVNITTNVNVKTCGTLTMKNDKLNSRLENAEVKPIKIMKSDGNILESMVIKNHRDLNMETDVNTLENKEIKNSADIGIENNMNILSETQIENHANFVVENDISMLNNTEVQNNAALTIQNDMNTFNLTKNNEDLFMESDMNALLKIKVEKPTDLLNENSTTVNVLSNDLSLQSESIEEKIVVKYENIKQECSEQDSKDGNKKVKRRVHKKKKPGETSKNTVFQNDCSTVISNGKVCGSAELNNSLNQLMNYGSDSDSSDVEVIQDNSTYRQTNLPFSEDSEKDSDSDSSSTSSSTSLFFSNLSDCAESDDDDNCGAIKKTTNNNNRYVKTKGELTLEDLPPVEDLKITVLEEECLPVGKVFQIVDKLVVVQSLKQTPVIDLDSVLFVEGGQPLGRVFDVFGPVTEPYYCVRFNSNQQIKDKNIAKNQTVYVAPKTEHTNYVFVSHLLKLKGSDASWTDNNEPPKHCLDFSDDEEEKNARRTQRQNTVKTEVVDPDEPARKRPNAYEQRMNERNLRISASASIPKNAWRGRVFAVGRPVPNSDVIWPPAMSPSSFSSSSSPQSPMHMHRFTSDSFVCGSPFTPFTPSPINYQFGNSPFPLPSQVNHQFGNSSFSTPNHHQFGNPSLPPPSPVNHHFGNSTYRPTVNHQYGNSPLPPNSPVNHQFGGSPFRPPVNHQYGNSPLPPPSPVNHQFGNSPFHPPVNQQFGNSPMSPPANHQFGNSLMQQSANHHFGKSLPPVNQQFGNSPFPSSPIVHHRPPAAAPRPQFSTGHNAPFSSNTSPLQFPTQGPNPNQFWTQAPVYPLQRNNFKH